MYSPYNNLQEIKLFLLFPFSAQQQDPKTSDKKRFREYRDLTLSLLDHYHLGLQQDNFWAGMAMHLHKKIQVVMQGDHLILL